MVTFLDAKEVASYLVNQVHPLLITLFGSVARHDIGNDLDLLVVLDDADYHGIETDALVQRALGVYYHKFDIEPFILSASCYVQQTRAGSPFLNAILKDGRVLYMNNYVNEWLRQAEEELSTAKYLMVGGFSRSACYHAQQAVEKFLKAQLIGKGWDIEKTHSLRRLLAISEEYGLTYVLKEDDITFIDSIYRGRYPAEAGILPQGEPSGEDAERAVSVTIALLNGELLLP